MTVLAVFVGDFGLDCYGINVSDNPSRCSCRTKPDCHPYRSSRAVYRFGRSGGSGFVGRFRLLRLSSCVPAPAVLSCLGRCCYRYICRPVGFLAVNGCRPKRIRVPLWGCLRSRNRVRASGLEISYGLRLANSI